MIRIWARHSALVCPGFSHRQQINSLLGVVPRWRVLSMSIALLARWVDGVVVVEALVEGEDELLDEVLRELELGFELYSLLNPKGDERCCCDP